MSNSSQSLAGAIQRSFLGDAPDWYKATILAFLALNPILLAIAGPIVAGWVLVGQFIFTLAMALKCYPLLPGGLLAIEAVAIGLTSADTVTHKVQDNFDVLLLLIFMVAGIYFLKGLLLFVFSRILIGVRSKVMLSLLFCAVAAFLSAFLDALTVTAVVIAVAVGFYGIFHKIASGKGFHADHDHGGDDEVQDAHRTDLEQFRSFLRSLLMHAVVGTALGGVMTMVGEPQNLLIATKAHWGFGEFFLRMLPISLPVLICGLLTCVLLELTGWFGYGAKLPDSVRKVMEDFTEEEDNRRSKKEKVQLVMQALTAVWLIVALGMHLASVGLIGLSVIVLATSLCGVSDEHSIGPAFKEALPFTALLTVFFGVVAVIYDQQLFKPVIDYVLAMEQSQQASAFYLANGILSAISDNVFVATVYIDEVKSALLSGQITRDAFDMLAVAINTGTNLPSVATPNGQAAFLFLLTSSIAPLIRLSYGRMVIMALPYTIVLTVVGLLMVMKSLVPATDWMYQQGLINHHTVQEIAADEKDGKH